MSWQRIKQLNEERGAVLAQIKAPLTAADAEKRDLTAEELAKGVELRAKFDALTAQIDAFNDASAIDAALAAQEQRSKIGRSAGATASLHKEVRRYSLTRAIGLAMRNLPLDGLEAEVNAELIKRSGKQPQGTFYMPIGDAEFRDLDLTNGAGAKPTITDPTQFIDLLRNKTILNTVGTRFLTGLSGDMSLPKKTAASTAYWVAESAAATESTPTIGQISLAPKTVAAYTDISRKFILQSSISAEQFVRADLADTLAIEIDRAGLNGSGSGAEPQGILQASGTNTVAMGTNGAAPTWAKIVEMETAVAALNADIGALHYVFNAVTRGKLKTTEKAAGTTGNFIWGETAGATVNGYSAHATNQLPSNLTKGSASGICSAGIFGNFDDLVIGMWGGLDILVDPYTGATSGTVRVVAMQDVDVKLRRAGSFSKVVDFLTT